MRAHLIMRLLFYLTSCSEALYKKGQRSRPFFMNKIQADLVVKLVARVLHQVFICYMLGIRYRH